MTKNNTALVQQMLLQLRTAFVEEMPEKLSRLENLLLLLEKEPTNVDAFNDFFRIVHSLKGGGGTHGLQFITTICHQLEDLLTSWNEQVGFSPKLIRTCLQYIDLLKFSISGELDSEEHHLKIDKELHKLQKQQSLENITILMVDNTKLYTNIYLKVLSGLPVKIVVAHDGILALVRALNEAFDIVITTNEIPKLNGVAMISALRLSDANSRSAQTILITSNQKLNDLAGQSTGPNQVILKDGALVQNLYAAVNQALSKVIR